MSPLSDTVENQKRKVFISVSSDCGIDIADRAFGLSKTLDFIPIVYVGDTRFGYSERLSISSEVESEILGSCAAFILVSPSPKGEELKRIETYMGYVRGSGVKVSIAVVGGVNDEKDLGSASYTAVSNCEDWLEKFKNELQQI